MEIRFPMWLRVVGRPGAREFAVLSAVEAFSRALIAGVIPLEAHALLVEAQTISLAYAGVGIVAFATSFMVPLVLLRPFRRLICGSEPSAPVRLMRAALLTGLAAIWLIVLGIVLLVFNDLRFGNVLQMSSGGEIKYGFHYWGAEPIDSPRKIGGGARFSVSRILPTLMLYLFDLPVGRLQVRLGGGLAGHNGLRSMRGSLGSMTSSM